MIKHIILWTLKSEIQGEERLKVIEGIREGLEGLSGKIPGLIDIHVYGGESALSSSNADVMLDATLESEEALKVYAQHPEHLAVANGKVRPFTAVRSCLDFHVDPLPY